MLQQYGGLERRGQVCDLRMEASRFVHNGFYRMARGLNPPPWNQGGKEEALSVNEKMDRQKWEKKLFLDIWECISELFVVVGLLHQ